MSVFARFPARLQEAIVSRLGWTVLRPIQELAGEAILDGKNVVVLAPTAGGKTEASIFPALAGLVEREPEGVGVIYVAPIKALLNNQDERLGGYAEMVGLRHFLWHGDVGDSAKRKFIREPAQILMTTPESLEVMLVSARSPVSRIFKDLRLVIVDEVHALAGTDRGAHLMSVVERLVRVTENDVQRVGLSATVGNPDVILEWLKGSSGRQGAVIDPPKAPATRALSVGLHGSVAELASRAAAQAAAKKSLFFCQSRSRTETVAERMRGRSIDVFVHHSSVSLEERKAAEERAFGRKNFMELYAVFSSPKLYRVETAAGRDLGSLEQTYVDRLVEQMSSFLLGGRAWTVERVNHEDRVVVVRDAPGGIKPSWGGYIPQHLGFELCQRIKGVLTEEIRYPYVDEAGFKHISEKRGDLAGLLRREGPALQLDEEVARWWTFAGGRVNHTLKYGFEVAEGWKIVSDNFQLRIEGDGITHQTVDRAIGKMSSPSFWDEPGTRRAVLGRLPGYRLSKFQDCLPEKFALEVIENYLLDVAGTVRWLTKA